MDVFQLLTDDHSVIGSQVIHVVALHRAVVDDHFAAAALPLELRRQARLLAEQIAEHFDFEEQVVFQQLAEKFPEGQFTLLGLLDEHDEVLAAFEEFQADLDLERSEVTRASSLSKGERFYSIVEHHATAETRLFDELERRIRRSSGDRLPVEFAGTCHRG